VSGPRRPSRFQATHNTTRRSGGYRPGSRRQRIWGGILTRWQSSCTGGSGKKETPGFLGKNSAQLNGCSSSSLRMSMPEGRLVVSYSLRPILLFANTNVPRHILVIDTSVLAKSIMNRRE
jgi:hypothetical protein